MTSAEIRALAKNDPNRLVRLIERGKMEPEEFSAACAIAGKQLPKQSIQRVLLRHLQKAKSAGEWEQVMEGLSWHMDALVESTIQRLMDTSPSQAIRECASHWLMMMDFDEDEPDPDDEAVQT
jgi:hypothetical protein